MLIENESNINTMNLVKNGFNRNNSQNVRNAIKKNNNNIHKQLLNLNRNPSSRIYNKFPNKSLLHPTLIANNNFDKTNRSMSVDNSTDNIIENESSKEHGIVNTGYNRVNNFRDHKHSHHHILINETNNTNSSPVRLDAVPKIMSKDLILAKKKDLNVFMHDKTKFKSQKKVPFKI